MISGKKGEPGSYRARAEHFRQKARVETDEAVRKALLDEAALWEGMADYEEKNLERHQ
jgi:hypothetical protein